MESSEYRDIVDFAPLENEFKKDKCRTKSNFTRSRTKLSDLLEENATFNRREIKDARKRMETCLELVMDVLTNFSDFYTKYGEHQKKQTDSQRDGANRSRFLFSNRVGTGMF